MRIVDLKFSNYVPMLRENAKFILIVSLASCAASFLVAGVLMDDSYWSEAQIRVLYGASSPTENRNPDRAVVSVRERMTQHALERVIADNGLYPQERRNGSLAEALKAIERDLSTSVLREDVVRLAFQANDPGLAQKVTSQLASQYEDGVSQAPTQDDRVLLGLQDDIKKTEADLARYQARIDSAPKVRSLQSGIVRGNAKLRYQELPGKKNKVEMAKAAKRNSGPNFQVLSPASYPDTPSNSLDRFMVKLSGLVWGPLLAIGLVALRRMGGEQKLSLEQVISESGVPVLASIPWIPEGSVQPNSQAPSRDFQRSSTQII